MLFSDIVMMLQVDPRLAIITEGVEDCAIIDPHLDEATVQTIPGHSKTTVLRAAQLLEQQKENRVIAYVDSDFDKEFGKVSSWSSNVLSSEFYDLEADLFFANPELLKSLLSSFGVRSLVSELSKNIDIHYLVVQTSATVGKIRYHSEAFSLEIKLDRFPMDRILGNVQAGIESIDQQILDIANGRTRLENVRIRITDIEESSQAFPDYRRLCRGHDLIAALGKILREKCGSSISASNLGRAFRAAVSVSFLRRIGLHKDIENWARNRGKNAWAIGSI